jgi:hypothetical protein
MQPQTRRLAAILLIVYPAVVYGGGALLMQLVHKQHGYVDNPLREDLWRAGHAHAGVLLVLSLVLLRYVDEAYLSPAWKTFARHSTPLAAILLPVGFFLSMLSPDATSPNALIYCVPAGGLLLTAGFFTLGIGLLRRPPGT